MTKPKSSEFQAFDDPMGKLLKVPHTEAQIFFRLPRFNRKGLDQDLK
jgi:hypothetical protein